MDGQSFVVKTAFSVDEFSKEWSQEMKKRGKFGENRKNGVFNFCRNIITY